MLKYLSSFIIFFRRQDSVVMEQTMVRPRWL